MGVWRCVGVGALQVVDLRAGKRERVGEGVPVLRRPPGDAPPPTPPQLCTCLCSTSTEMWRACECGGRVSLVELRVWRACEWCACECGVHVSVTCVRAWWACECGEHVREAHSVDEWGPLCVGGWECVYVKRRGLKSLQPHLLVARLEQQQAALLALLPQPQRPVSRRRDEHIGAIRRPLHIVHGTLRAQRASSAPNVREGRQNGGNDCTLHAIDMLARGARQAPRPTMWGACVCVVGGGNGNHCTGMQKRGHTHVPLRLTGGAPVDPARELTFSGLGFLGF
eukprot:362037-Chlamydomonas_euryale.AAC.1